VPLRIAPAEIPFDTQDKRSYLPVPSCEDTGHLSIGWRAGLSQHAVIEYLGPAPDAPEVTANE
jgi:hypothetical protein